MSTPKFEIPDWLVKAMFLSLLAEQALDLHSTLTAPSHRTEVNPVIVWIASHVGISVAMLFIKSCAALVIVALSKLWRKGGSGHNRIYAITLLALNLEYAVIVINNYSF